MKRNLFIRNRGALEFPLSLHGIPTGLYVIGTVSSSGSCAWLNIPKIPSAGRKQKPVDIVLRSAGTPTFISWNPGEGLEQAPIVQYQVPVSLRVWLNVIKWKTVDAVLRSAGTLTWTSQNPE